VRRVEVATGEGTHEVAAVAGAPTPLATEQDGFTATQPTVRDSELGADVARGEQPVVANADVAGRHHLLREAKEEGDGMQRGLAAVPGREGDVAVADVEQAVIADRDAVGAATEVPEDVLGTTEGRSQ
jgi:hypothetical protein